MSNYITINMHPDKWEKKQSRCYAWVTMAPWQHTLVKIGSIKVLGRKHWGAPDPVWKNEVTYYNVPPSSLAGLFTNIVVHHTNNMNPIKAVEKKQMGQGYAALGYHFFIQSDGQIFEGRPLQVMGSHAGVGKTSGVLNDPDWGAIGIVLQGDFHHEYFDFSDNDPTKKQLASLEKLIVQLKTVYKIPKMLMHREVVRSGTKTVCPGDQLVPKIKALRTKLKM